MQIRAYNLFVLSGFNRYMVECESFSLLVRIIRYLRFNRYMVECEWRSKSFSDVY